VILLLSAVVIAIAWVYVMMRRQKIYRWEMQQRILLLDRFFSSSIWPQNKAKLLVDKLLTNEEYLSQLIANGQNTVTTTRNGEIQLTQVPQVSVNGNIASIVIGSNRVDAVKLNGEFGNDIQFNFYGPRGGVRASERWSEWALKQLLVALEIAREE